MLTSDGVGIGGTSIASDMIDTGTGIVGVAMRSRDSSAMHNSAARSRNTETVLQRGAHFTHGVPDPHGVFTENTASNWYDAGVVTMDARTVADYAAKHAGEGFLTEAQCGNFETDGKLSTLGYADVVGAGTFGGTPKVSGGIAALECMNGKLHSGVNLERRLIDVSVASYALPFRHPSSRRPSWPTSPPVRVLRRAQGLAAVQPQAQKVEDRRGSGGDELGSAGRGRVYRSHVAVEQPGFCATKVDVS